MVFTASITLHNAILVKIHCVQYEKLNKTHENITQYITCCDISGSLIEIPGKSKTQLQKEH